MTEEATQERLGLCLSGGGFRASFYALGALRYLAESEHLLRVGAISAVSGARSRRPRSPTGGGASRQGAPTSRRSCARSMHRSGGP